MRPEVIQSLYDEHRNIERVLLLIRFQSETLQGTNDLQAFELLNNAIGYMHNYPGVTHHPCEEIILARLPALHPPSNRLCEEIKEQHKRFANQEIAMLRLIREAQSGEAQSCRELKQVATEYCAQQAKHIISEESELFPLADQHLKDQDWQEVYRRSKSVIDPIFGQGALQHYQSLYDYLMSSKAAQSIH
ncbi:MAG: hemerythrin domain-containing protein [Gammaproteobacteria bacterium]|nr:hemerythrin domain-containing protein [Gammaproteobacteria bacterium]MDE2346812.1 hemerythrin domain-containing protein [Gammaproteobacteria bacterium]